MEICPICNKKVSEWQESNAHPVEYGYQTCHLSCVCGPEAIKRYEEFIKEKENSST